MEIYNSEQEQVEAIKKWWDENGRSVIAGAVIAIAGVVGWQYWVGYRNGIAESASNRYQTLLEQTASDPAQVLDRGRQIASEYPSSAYASLAALEMAAASVKKDDLDGAAAQLRSVIDAAHVPEVDKVARVRLAQVLLAQGKAQEALGLLKGADSGSFRGLADETLGDIHLALGDRKSAHDAYQNALSGYRDVPEKQRIVQMKLDDLSDVQESAQ